MPILSGIWRVEIIHGHCGGILKRLWLNI